MNLKKSYHYLFYKLYRFSENAPSKWLSEWKSTLAIDVLTYFILLSIGGYYTVVTKKDMLPFNHPKLIIGTISVLIAMLNYIFFIYQDKWKEYIIEFDNWPKKKNKTGSIVVLVVILIIVLNLLFMFYLLSQIDWRQYR